MQYPVVIESSATGYSAYSPDVPGCIAAAKTLDAVTRLMREALQFHFEDMQEMGEPIPLPTSQALMLDVDVPEKAPSTSEEPPPPPRSRQRPGGRNVQSTLGHTRTTETARSGAIRSTAPRKRTHGESYVVKIPR